MTILARYTPRNILSEVIDTYEQGGVTLAVIKACEGKPFADGAKQTIQTAYLTVKVCELQPVQSSLLTLAMEFSNKQQWSAGESVWLWRSPNKGAFLKEQHGIIHLCLLGIQASCPVFRLDRQGWRPVINLANRYQSWKEKIRQGAQ
jgi:hypothetical protein